MKKDKYLIHPQSNMYVLKSFFFQRKKFIEIKTLFSNSITWHFFTLRIQSPNSKHLFALSHNYSEKFPGFFHLSASFTANNGQNDSTFRNDFFFCSVLLFFSPSATTKFHRFSKWKTSFASFLYITALSNSRKLARNFSSFATTSMMSLKKRVIFQRAVG